MSNLQESSQASLEQGSGSAPRRPRRRPPSVFWPLVFISAGVMLLLVNLGYLPRQSWAVVWRLWPVLLIALGIDVLFGRRSVFGAVFGGLLILLLFGGVVAVVFFARNIPGLAEITRPPDVHIRHIAYELGDVERAAVEIDWSSMPGSLGALDDSPNLIEGTIAYRGELIFDVYVDGDQADVDLDSHFSGSGTWPFGYAGRQDHRWDVELSPNVPLDLTLDAGSGSFDFDLSDLQVSDLFLDAGSGAGNLILPPDSTFDARIEGGSGALVITLPDGVGARVVLDSGSGSFDPDGRFRLVDGERDDDSVWETDDYDSDGYVIELTIDQGSGSIRVR